MPKILEYPRASLKASLDLAKAVSDLGGSAKIETVAEKMGLKVSGSFRALIGAAGKYGLIETTRGQLVTTGTYREYRHAYNEEEAAKVLKKVFLGVPLFQKIYDRFHDTKLPIEILDKILIREFAVDEAVASKVAGYLLDAGRLAKMLNGDNTFLRENSFSKASEDLDSWESIQELDETEVSKEYENTEDLDSKIDLRKYTIHFKGPGIDSKIQILDEDDILIVEAILAKIKKGLKESAEEFVFSN